MFYERRLHAFKQKVEVGIGEWELENFGFKHIKRMMKTSKDVQALKLYGSSGEYFNCTLKRMRKLEFMVQKMPAKKQIEFFELNQCKFDHTSEAAVLFNSVLLNKNMSNEVKYLTIQRCRICPGLIDPIITNFIFENESLVRFSWIMNNNVT